MDKILLGEIINVRGLKGEVKIDSTSSFGSIRYQKGNKIILEKDNDVKVLTCLSYSKNNNFDYVKFIEITNVDDANMLRGYKVYIDKSYIKPIENGYYYYELMGLEVYDELENKIGIIEEVIDNPANTIIRVKTTNNSILVPFVKTFIKNVDIQNKKIIIHMMEGLL